MKKILLINPHTPEFVKCRDRSIPIGLLYLAAVLQKKNYAVKFIDANNDVLSLGEKGESAKYFASQFINQIEDFKPDFIGIGCLFSGRFKTAIFLSKLIKEKLPTVPIVLGGIHPTMFPREILKGCNNIDYIVLGEGEKSLPQLIEAHFNDKKNLKNIDGVAYRDGNSVFVNEKTSFIENLDELPFPAYGLINLQDYYFDTSKWHNPRKLPINVPLPLITSRGCPGRCTFCSMYVLHGRRFRARSAKNVVDEIEYLYRAYGHRYFSIMDDNFTFSKERTIAIAKEIIARGLNIQFDTPNGILLSTLDKEVMDALVKAGLIRTCVAIESGSEYMRNKIMQKGVATKKIYDFFDAVKNSKDLFVKAFFVIGYPQETKESLGETYEMIRKIAVKQIAIFFAVPFPGTALFEYCKAKNLLRLSEHDLQNLHNNETFSNYNDSDKPFIKPYKLTMRQLTEFREKAYLLVNKAR